MKTISEAPSPAPNDSVSSAIWRGIMQATAVFEQQWLQGVPADPLTFARAYPELPVELLIPELQALAQELRGPTGASIAGLRPLGRGGMGEVFEGQDEGCGRLVAVKKIRSDLQTRAEVRRRFRSEVELTASLEHPGVIPIYSVGVDQEGRDFYTMRLIRGAGTGTLADAIRDYHKTPGNHTILMDLIRRLIDVSNTIAYAHHEGVVHRDLKPSNILIGAFGETLIADWGLARRVNSHSAGQSPPAEDFASAESHDYSVTQDVGTPGYAAPELGDSMSASMLRAVDIYSLGAVLYCILTGQRPGVNGQPFRPVAVKGRNRVLAAISRRAMADSPQDRYSSVEEFREDLKRWSTGLPTTACPERWWETLARWPGRHRAAAAGLAGAACILFVGGTVLLYLKAQKNQLLASQKLELQEANDRVQTRWSSNSQKILQKTRELLVAVERMQTQLSDARKARTAANEARNFALQSEALAYKELQRFQQLLVTAHQVPHVPALQAFQQEMSEQFLLGFDALLHTFENETRLNLHSVQRIAETAERLASIECSLGSPASANTLLEKTCHSLSEIQQRQVSAGKGIPQTLNLHLGCLRSLQGTLLMQNSQPSQALPRLDEAIRLLVPLLTDPELSQNQASAAAIGWLNAISAVTAHAANNGELRKAVDLIQQALPLDKIAVQNSLRWLIAESRFQAIRSIVAEQQADISSAIDHLKVASGLVEQAFDQLATDAAAPDSATFGTVHPSAQLLSDRSGLAHDRVRLLTSANRADEAVTLLTSLAKQEFETLSTTPQNSALQEMTTRTVRVLNELLLKSGRIELAYALAADWISVAKIVIQQDAPTVSSVQFAVQAHGHAGQLYQQHNRKTDAFNAYSQALEICRSSKNATITPRNLVQQVELEIHRVQLRLESNSPNEIQQYLRAAIDAATRLKLIAPENNTDRATASRHLQSGLDSLQAVGLTEAAAELKHKIDELAQRP